MKKLIISAVILTATLALSGPMVALAATTPSLGAAVSYAVLASTYTNTTAGTVVSGDVGFTTGPAVAPAGTHANYGSGAPYATAGANQSSALSALASQACTFTFASGAINLSTDTTHGAIGVYNPGVYCSTGAMNVGGPLSLNGSGTYIFRSDGALNSTAGAIVSVTNGASPCDVFWTPSAATTLAANTTFLGTVIDSSGITVGANTNWTGRALAFGGTVTTDTDNITAPTCTVTPVSTSTTTPVVTLAPTTTPVTFVTPAPTPVATLISEVAPVVAPVATPALPNTGISPDNSFAPWNVVIPAGIFVSLLAFYVLKKKQLI